MVCWIADMHEAECPDLYGDVECLPRSSSAAAVSRFFAVAAAVDRVYAPPPPADVAGVLNLSLFMPKPSRMERA